MATRDTPADGLVRAAAGGTAPDASGENITGIPPRAAEACRPAATATLPDADRAAALADVFKALADPTRVRLLGYVASAEGGTVCACHLTDELGISQPTLSHHLKKLVAVGLLAREQRGRWAHYTVIPAALERARGFLGSATGA